MIKLQLILSTVVLCIITSWNTLSSDNPENWSQKKLAKWFHSGEWKSGWTITPDESVNPKQLALHVFKNKARWEKAFLFLKTNDLKNLKPGKYELEGDSLYVNVSIYKTKNLEDTQFEAHRKYADIQYLVSGKEQMGIAPLCETKIITPYNEAKDVSFLTAAKTNFRIAGPEKFFIFFPDDAHRPNIKVENNEEVKKVVVKVKL